MERIKHKLDDEEAKKFRAEEFKFLECIKNVLVENAHLFVEIKQSSRVEDMTQCFDIVTNFNDHKIAVRIRGSIYHSKYCDFTIRSEVGSGNDTEIGKIKEGKGEIYLYAWKNNDETKFKAYA